MKYNYRFENILTVREQEKQEAEMAYKESVKNFEDVATRLYELLKKKEDLLEYQRQRLQTGASIDEISHYANFLTSMERTIEDVQQKVVQARAKMNWHEQKLLEKNLELRKYEKMKEKDFEAFRAEQNRLDTILLDELSGQAYFRKEIR